MNESSSELMAAPALDLVIHRDPAVVLAEAQRAAAALKDVIGRNQKPVVFAGEQYLEFEDWQTIGRFYGITARVLPESVRYVEYGDVVGYEATAEAYHAESDRVLSIASSMCLSDELNWRRKPLFQLRSMSQTRACCKAMRNVLSWIVVLAGYRPTPAEEMDGVAGGADVSRAAGRSPNPGTAKDPPELAAIVNRMHDKTTIGTELHQLLLELIGALGEPTAMEEYRALLAQHGVSRWEELKSVRDAKQFAREMWNKVQAAGPPRDEADAFEPQTDVHYGR
jgi:hypothetical protein